MINPSVSSLFINIKVGKVVVDVTTSRTQMTTKQRRMCREYCTHVMVSTTRQQHTQTGHPLVEVPYHRPLER